MAQRLDDPTIIPRASANRRRAASPPAATRKPRRRPPAPRPAESQPPYSLRILHAIRRLIRVVDLDSRQLATHHQITAPQLLTLMAVVEQQSTTSIALARRVHLDASTLVRVIDRLEAKGLIRRARDSHDRRHVRLSVTRSGRALVARTPFPLQYSLEKALRQMPEAERARLAGCLETLVRRISAPAPQDVPPPPLLEILGRARATTAGF